VVADGSAAADTASLVFVAAACAGGTAISHRAHSRTDVRVTVRSAAERQTPRQLAAAPKAGTFQRQPQSPRGAGNRCQPPGPCVERRSSHHGPRR
jgi:hypothetical protein